MYLLHDLVNVDAVALLAPTSPLLVSTDRTFCVSGLLLALSASFGRHADSVCGDLSVVIVWLTRSREWLLLLRLGIKAIRALFYLAP